MVKERTRKTRMVFKLSEIKKKVRVSGFRETQKHEQEAREEEKKLNKKDILKMLDE